MNNPMPYFNPFQGFPQPNVNNFSNPNCEHVENKIERLEKQIRVLENRVNLLEKKTIETNITNQEEVTDMYML